MRLGFLSPRLMSHVKYGIMCNLNVFPRRVRNTTPEGTIILQSYLSICTVRTRRLLASPDELRREVGDLVELKHSTLSYSVDVPPFAKRREGEWQFSLDRARSIPVVENDLTKEFFSARSNPHWTGYSDGYGRWEYYKTLQRKCHRMGEYCRSNLDWDWDATRCLQRLFKMKKAKGVTPSRRWSEARSLNRGPHSYNAPLRTRKRNNQRHFSRDHSGHANRSRESSDPCRVRSGCRVHDILHQSVCG